MSNITLADYVGFIFSEITRARDHADRVAKDMAIAYSKDDVLKHFSVPRFKIPEMELTIPVLISSAKFSNAMAFTMPPEDFAKYVNNRVNSAIQTLLIQKSKLGQSPENVKDDVFDIPIFRQPVEYETSLVRTRKSKKAIAAAVPAEDPVDKFYRLLKENSEPARPENIAQVCLAEMFNARLVQYNLSAFYKEQYPGNEMFTQMVAEVVTRIKEYTMVTQSKMENLLVNPETNIVKNGSSDATVFTIKARIQEEGVFVKTVRNEETGQDQQIVEFE
ncbi:hypothetical protein ACQKLP_13870 [Chitinophaga sp. NPDC101104]|uniref:hypothetical protein n=1 Tax=Chitinophaga sp. NPDC101104 TaxID=3390561 RepID=UPI003CFE4DD1